MGRVADGTTQRILLVSYWYPPAVGAAAERIAGFARYLPQHGLEVHVLTAAHGAVAGGAFALNSAEATQDGAGANGGSAIVHRVEDPMATGPAFADYDPRQTTPLWKRLAREVVFPDRFARWAKAAEAAGTALLRDRRFAVILASFPPASAARLGMRLSQASGVPLVLDFRDLWFGPGGYEPKTPLARMRLEGLYRECVRSSKALLAVSDAMADALSQEHGLDRSRVFTIPNGYEPAEALTRSRDEVTATSGVSITRASPDDVASGLVDDNSPGRNASGHAAHDDRTITIAHVGTVIARNRPDVFLRTVKELADAGELKGVRFRFVGNLSRDYLASLKLGEAVETTGLVDRATARREMEQADALLLLVGEYVGRWGHNAKLFEYVQTGRPILCVEEAEGSNDRKLLERFIADRTFDAELGNGAKLRETLNKLQKYLVSRASPALELDVEFRDYSRSAITQNLFESLAHSKLIVKP